MRRFVRQWAGWLVVTAWVVRPAAATPMQSPWQEFVRPWLARTEAVTQSPTDAIKGLDHTLAGYQTGADLTAEQAAANRRIKDQVVRGTFDLRELSRISLARHWTVLTDAERDRFVRLMIDLLERKAILSKEQGQRETKRGAVYTVQYRGHRFLDPIKSRALTRTAVRVPARNLQVALDYKLRRGGGTWKIYDVIVDGSSLVENYQYQFDAIITKHGFGELLARMQRKLDELTAEPRP